MREYGGSAVGYLRDGKWKVDRILDERDDGSEVFVRWFGWAAEHDSWKPAADVDVNVCWLFCVRVTCDFVYLSISRYQSMS